MIDPEFSVVIPVYNEEEVIQESYDRISSVMKGINKPYELIFVNDGSEDKSEELLYAISQKDSAVRVINFSRNFGHQISITAGLDHARGDKTVIIDGDLQDPPEVIPEMITKFNEGYNVVYGRRKKRKGETWFKKTSAKIYYRLLSLLTESPIPVDVGDFRMVDHKVKEELLKFREHDRYMRGLISWLGYKQGAVEYDRDRRHSGETKYTLNKMLSLSSDGIISFSTKPLMLSVYFGFLTSVAAFIYLLIVIYQAFFTDTTVTGWASIVCILLFFNGIILLSIGIIGMYIARIFSESKNRPLYIIKSRF